MQAVSCLDDSWKIVTLWLVLFFQILFCAEKWFIECCTDGPNDFRIYVALLIKSRLEIETFRYCYINVTKFRKVISSKTIR